MNLRGSIISGRQSNNSISANTNESAPNNDLDSLQQFSSALRRMTDENVQEWADDDDDDDDFASTKSQQQQVFPPGNNNMTIDVSSFTETTTICQDNPTFHFNNNQTCAELFLTVVLVAGEVDEKCDELLVDNEVKGEKVKDVCKRSCGLCGEEGGLADNSEEEDIDDEKKDEIEQIKETIDNEVNYTEDDGSGDTDENEDSVTELEGKLMKDDVEEEEGIEVLNKKDEQGKNSESEVADDEEDVQKKEEEEEDEGVNEVDNSELEADDDDEVKVEADADEKEELVLKKADEDDAFIPEEDVDEAKEESAVIEDEGGEEEEQFKKGHEGGLEEKEEEKDLGSAPEQQDTETDVEGSEGHIEEEKEDLDSSPEQQDTETDAEGSEKDIEEEAVSTTDGKDEQTEEVESKLDMTHDKGTDDDEDVAEQLEEEIEEVLEESIEKDDGSGDDSGGNDSIDAAAVEEEEEETVIDESSNNNNDDEEEIKGATDTKDESILCQDDPNFEYKGKKGFNCAYIKEKKPDKCDKKHDGVKVGLLSCPVSCGMVDECMALQQEQEETKKNVTVESSDETVVTEESAEPVDDLELSESEEESPVAANDSSDESAKTEQKDDLQLEKEMESELETALEKGTVDEETAEKLDEEMLEALEEGVGEVFEKELEEELGLAGEDNDEEVSDDLSKDASANDEDEDKDLATIDELINEDSSGVEEDDLAVVANVTLSEDDSSFCQDDPDFKFKGYEGFNCAYIKENKPEKCNKIHSGEKVGVVSCPVSCDMVDECLALRESQVDAVLDNVVENVETGSEAASEEDADVTDTTAEETVDEEAEDTLEDKEDDATTDETSVEVVEGSGDTQVETAGNTTEVVNYDDEALATEADTEDEEDGGEGLVEEKNIASSDEEATNIDETTGVCQDDPDFKFKGYEGFNCAYIKENKPEKCNKIHSGEKVGVVSCPVSCDMVEECMALRESQVDAVLDNVVENDETGSEAASDEDADVTDTTAEETVDEEAEDTLEGETTDETSVEVVEGSDDTQVGAAGNTTEVVNYDDEALATEADTNIYIDTENEEDGGEELLEEQKSTPNNEEAADIADTTGLCQDDPDFKFKGYEGFNCAYIKENKPEKCNKIHSGEKVGVVSCPVSCDMVEECLALQEQKGSADDTQLGSDEEETSNATTEENASDETTDPTAEAATVSIETESDSETNEDEDVNEEVDELDEKSVMTDEDEATEEAKEETEVVTQSTITSPETKQDDDEIIEDQSLSDLELEEEIEAKLEKALEEGELDFEEAEELEYEMEEALEEGVGEIFEVELDKELRCKDDPDFVIVDDDGQLRNCAWLRHNEIEKCRRVHEYTGKSIGLFFCPEACGMEKDCEMVTAADSTLQSPETEEDDSFEAPKGMKSMVDEIKNESGFENGSEPSQEYKQEPNSYVDYSQPTNGVENWQGYGGDNQQGGSFDNNPQPINYDENWLEDDDGFPFGLLILLFLGVGFFIFKKSQNSSRLQDNSRGGYQRVGRQNHTRRYDD